MSQCKGVMLVGSELTLTSFTGGAVSDCVGPDRRENLPLRAKEVPATPHIHAFGKGRPGIPHSWHWRSSARPTISPSSACSGAAPSFRMIRCAGIAVSGAKPGR